MYISPKIKLCKDYTDNARKIILMLAILKKGNTRTIFVQLTIKK